MGLVATSNPHQITEGGRETSAVVGSTCFLRILTPQIFIKNMSTVPGMQDKVVV